MAFLITMVISAFENDEVKEDQVKKLWTTDNEYNAMLANVGFNLTSSIIVIAVKIIGFYFCDVINLNPTYLDPLSTSSVK